MRSQYVKNLKLPDKPGVYFFLKGKDILYIGKATSIRDRVKSYFNKDIINSRGPMILDMVTLANNIKWQETDSVLEALILEANLIKKYQPKYNTKEKDNKSFNYVCITKDLIPKALVIRGRNLNTKTSRDYENFPRFTPKGPYTDKNFHNLASYSYVFGPFPNGSQLKEAMKIIRRIFPYIDNDSIKKHNKEFYKQLGLVPTEETSQKASSQQYNNNIKNLKLFFQGKKKSIINGLKKEMMTFAKNKEFEKSGEIKKKIFALEHINDVSLIKDEYDALQNNENFPRFTPERPYTDKNFHYFASQKIRIEAYDIAHMSGKNMVGVMTVVENGEINKKEYKKFIIRSQTGANDTGALREVLSRRFTHSEWQIPNMIVVDGGTAQINVVKRILQNFKKEYSSALNIVIVSVVKDDKHKAKAIMGNENIIKKYKKDILLANSEAHRFAITFHKQRRNKNFINK